MKGPPPLGLRPSLADVALQSGSGDSIALRRAGLSIDFLPADTSCLDDLDLVLVPGLLTLPDSLRTALEALSGAAIIGPRTNSSTDELVIPEPLPPSLPGLDAKVSRVESLPPFARVPLEGGGSFRRWFEHMEGDAAVTAAKADGRPAVMSRGKMHYVAGWPDKAAFDDLVAKACVAEVIEARSLPDGLRIRDAATHRFVFNYAPEALDFEGTTLAPAGVHWHPV